MNRKTFGNRKGIENGHVVLGGRSRVFCRVIDRTDATIYLELSEPVLLPFKIQVSIGPACSVICEVKSQRSTMVVGSIVGETPLYANVDPTFNPPANETISKWVGFRRANGFKI